MLDPFSEEIWQPGSPHPVTKELKIMNQRNANLAGREHERWGPFIGKQSHITEMVISMDLI